MTFAGLGNIDRTAPLFLDGFMTEAEVDTCVEAGAVGEITGWLFDARGRLLEGLADVRVNSERILALHEPAGMAP